MIMSCRDINMRRLYMILSNRKQIKRAFHCEKGDEKFNIGLKHSGVRADGGIN